MESRKEVVYDGAGCGDPDCEICGLPKKLRR